MGAFIAGFVAALILVGAILYLRHRLRKPVQPDILKNIQDVKNETVDSNIDDIINDIRR